MLPLMMPSLRLRSRRPLRVRLPTYSTAPTMLSANWNSGPKLNCCTTGVSWFGSWMRHCTTDGFTVCGVSGVKPCAKVNAGASAAEFAVIDASTSCGRLSPSWLSLP